MLSKYQQHYSNIGDSADSIEQLAREVQQWLSNLGKELEIFLVSLWTGVNNMALKTTGLALVAQETQLAVLYK